MKPYSMSLAALAAIALAGCATANRAAPIDFPLTVQNNAAGSDAARFAAALDRGAKGTHAFHSASEGEPGTVLVTIDSVRPMDLAQPARGFTYIATWSRGGEEIGRQEDDCLDGEVEACAKEAAETMYSHVYYFSRIRR